MVEDIIAGKNMWEHYNQEHDNWLIRPIYLKLTLYYLLV